MKIYILACTIFLLLIISCHENPLDQSLQCPPIRILAQSPYNEPIWHPGGELIGFNHTPLERIEYPYGKNCQGEYFWKSDSAGFWLVKTDGTNMRRVLSFELETSSWSPDGNWIAFVQNAHIFKMPFDGESFDTSRIIQLTFEGKNYFPDWSSDGQSILYDSNIESPSGMNFIWKMKSDGTQKERIAYEPQSGEIRMPNWLPDGNEIVHQRYIGIGSPEIFSMDSTGNNLKRLTYDENFDSYPKYSPDGSKIAFLSQRKDKGLVNVWLMKYDGTELKQLTFEGSTYFDWSPEESEIVYLVFNYTDWSYENGTLWIIDVNTGIKKQLTFNIPNLNVKQTRRKYETNIDWLLV